MTIAESGGHEVAAARHEGGKLTSTAPQGAVDFDESMLQIDHRRQPALALRNGPPLRETVCAIPRQVRAA